MPKAEPIVTKNWGHDHSVKIMTLFENREIMNRPNKATQITIQIVAPAITKAPKVPSIKPMDLKSFIVL